jgi:uncharacterized protein
VAESLVGSGLAFNACCFVVSGRALLASMARFGKVFYIILGWFSVGLGILGIILPLLPSAPFLLVAVWAFSQSSPETAAKIRAHPILGPPILDWEKHGVIPLYAKIAAVAMMLGSGGYLWGWSGVSIWVLIAITMLYLAVAAFILSRPSRPRDMA